MNQARRERSSEDIRADIEETRERLGDTVEALGAHLNPNLLKQRLKDSVREATIGRVKHMASNARNRAEESGRGIASTIRDNPLPAAMIAGGIGWLLFNKRRESGVRRDKIQSVDGDEHRGEAQTTPYRGTGVGYAGEAVDYSREIPSVPEEGVAHHVASSARSAGERVTSSARSAGERVTSSARAAGDRIASGASSVAHGIADRATTSTHRVEEQYERNPLALGVVAAAVGLAVGLSLPTSEKEAELMGSKRDELVDKARETISDTKEKVRNVAERAVPEVENTIKDVARHEGLGG